MVKRLKRAQRRLVVLRCLSSWPAPLLLLTPPRPTCQPALQRDPHHQPRAGARRQEDLQALSENGGKQRCPLLKEVPPASSSASRRARTSTEAPSALQPARIAPTPEPIQGISCSPERTTPWPAPLTSL